MQEVQGVMSYILKLFLGGVSAACLDKKVNDTLKCYHGYSRTIAEWWRRYFGVEMRRD